MPETEKTQNQLLAEIESLRAQVAALQAKAPPEPAAPRPFRQMLESAPVGFALFDDGPRFLFINQTLADINGIAVENHLGRALSAVLPGLGPGIEPFMKRVRDSGESICDVEIVGQTAAAPDEPRHWLASYYPVRLDGGALGVGSFVLDMTERKRAEEALRRVEKTYRELVEYAPIGIFRTTPEGRYLMANSRLAEMYGFDSADDLKQSVDDIGAQFYMDQAERAAIRKAVERGEVKRMEVRRRRKDGSLMWVALSVRAVRDRDGKILHYEGFSNDITERKRAEELRDQIERTIRHDLRIPASNAIYLAKMIRNETSLTDELNQLLDYFEHAGQNMLDTLNSSLDLYKIETGQYQFESVACDCLALVREMIETLTKKVPFANLRLDMPPGGRHEPDARCPCRCEPKLLRMALQNLMVNALEASPSGGEVVVELSSDQDCRIAITNRGAVPADIRAKFFDKYVTRGKSRGTGIGTYSAMMMIKAQGGDIAMHTSDEDDETVVTVRMPS
jgi:PAS domain S-box-containing protein